MTLKVSLYIPCFNVEAYLAPVIEGVLAQTLPADEILIVDDGSTDRTLEIARRYSVTIVRHDKNRGLAAARNTGLHRAKNEFVAALDADCSPDPAWLETLVAALAEPKMAMAGGKLIETVLTSAADRWRQSHMPQDWGETRIVRPKFTFGSNTISRKSAVEEVGWYDERMRTNGEDVDISRSRRDRPPFTPRFRCFRNERLLALVEIRREGLRQRRPLEFHSGYILSRAFPHFVLAVCGSGSSPAEI